MDKKKKKPKSKPSSTKEVQKEIKEDSQDQFDFGGFPKDVDLKKNLGCGG